jgi:NADPH:quinone reductase-like Zn-dependent oxidoreductase
LEDLLMQAVVHTKYGSPDMLELREVAKPTPGNGEVLVKVRATAVNAYDWHIMRADPFLVRVGGMGLFRPKSTQLGADIAGEVEAVGQNVRLFRPGDAVFGDLAGSGGGGFAEYAAAPEKALAMKPANLSFAQAAALPMAAVTALQALRDAGQMAPGKQVLINGASGGVGTFAVQIARLLGGEVTAVCSTAKMEQARSLGADHVIDYTQEDFTRNGRQYDLILAVNGNRPLSAYKRALAPGGVYIMVGGSNSQIFQALLLGSLYSRMSGKKMMAMLAKSSQQDLTLIKEWVEAGKVMPVMDRCFPLSRVAEALHYVEAGHAKGKVVVTMG